MILQPFIFDNTIVTASQSTRQGGISAKPYDSLNLGLSVNDVRENVMENRRLFFGGLGIELENLVISHQVHGNKVFVADKPEITEGYDALITDKPNVYLAVSVADCTPILIHDTKHNAVAAIHAGWKGTVAGILTETLLKMKEHYGTNPTDCKAFIGACIGYERFQVGAEVAEHFTDEFKRYDAVEQKYYVDLKAANKAHLLNAGVFPENIEVSDYCTFKDEDLFFSHRRDKGVTGRMMATIGIK